jgi:hypothetical protein
MANTESPPNFWDELIIAASQLQQRNQYWQKMIADSVMALVI